MKSVRIVMKLLFPRKKQRANDDLIDDCGAPSSGLLDESLAWKNSQVNGWIGVDLDGTLAHYDEWEGIDVIGAPIIPMVNRVKSWLAEGIEVRIFTARVGGPADLAATARPQIERWCREHIGQKLTVTATKDFGMYELWDDRAVQVERNTGRRMDNEPDEHWTP
jgi:hypothetical protein